MFWKAIRKEQKSSGMGMEGGSKISTAVSKEELWCQCSVFACVQSLSFTQQNDFVILDTQKATFPQTLLPLGHLEGSEPQRQKSYDFI